MIYHVLTDINMQYIQVVDTNAHKRNAPVVLETRTFYGWIIGFLEFALPSTCPYQPRLSSPYQA
jgi:hypothetical protein